jgi:putative endonuclease
MTYYFYIVRCSDNSLYSGVTNDLKRRVKEHNSNTAKSAKYTRARVPVILIYHEIYPTIQEAMSREREVKKWKKDKKELLILSGKTLPNNVII